MTFLADVSRADLRELLGCRTMGNSLINCQNSTATFDIVSSPSTTIYYCINGASYKLSDFTNKVLATLDALQTPVTGQAGYYQQPVSTTVFYLVVVNAAGTVYTIQGTYSGQIISRNGGLNVTVGDGSIPDIAVKGTYAPVGVIKVVNGTNAVWIPATTNWDATGVTSSACAINILPALKDGSDLTFIAGGA